MSEDRALTESDLIGALAAYAVGSSVGGGLGLWIAVMWGAPASEWLFEDAGWLLVVSVVCAVVGAWLMVKGHEDG